MAQQHSGQRWHSLDGRHSANDEKVIPRHAGAGSGGGSASQEDGLVRLLYLEHAGPLLTFVLRLTGDRQHAEDIVQETLLRAWRNTDRLGAQGQQSLRPWLVTVARRLAISDYRRANARPAEKYGEELESFPSATDDTDRVLQSLTVADALRELSDLHREILIETYFRGRRVAEAAELFNVPLGTAKSRLYYALRALRTALQRRGVTA